MAKPPDFDTLARKAKREGRKARQRLENSERARKMHVARLADSLLIKAPLNAANIPGSPEYHIGCSGWFYWHWRGIFYPEGSPSTAWFSHYCAHFDTVELNAPFYSWPTLATVKGWIRQTGERAFVYTVKVCELITHTNRMSETETLVKDFGYIADMLGPQMGCFLFQLPPSFHYSPVRLGQILSQLDPTRKNVVEFRHESWWNETVFDAFQQSGIIFCSCSAPKLPDALIKTADAIYIRFHGKNRWYQHDYIASELEEWAQRIRLSGAKQVWIYFNNDRNGNAIKNASTLREMLRPVSD